MQNKANFQKSQMDAKLIITRDYEKKIEQDTWGKQSQTKPIFLSSKLGNVFTHLIGRSTKLTTCGWPKDYYYN